MVTRDPADPETATGLATRSQQFDTQALREINSLDEALAAINAAGITVVDATEVMGDGFELLDEKEKSQLVGVHFVIMSAAEAPGDYGKSFVSLRVVTKDGRKLIINDGSTGIRDQIVDYTTHHGSPVGLHFPNGLRASTYSFCEECKHIVGKSGVEQCPECSHSPMSPASTYYLDTSK